MPVYTPTQGRYLAFIHAYANLHGTPPSELEMARAMRVAPPSVNLMVKMLEKKGLIERKPGQARSIQILIPDDEIPLWNRDGTTKPAPKTPSRAPAAPTAPPASLYTMLVFLKEGPMSREFDYKVISRTIEIRGDQTLAQLHEAIFRAYDRSDEQPYEFQMGKRPFDPEGPNYGLVKKAAKVTTKKTLVNAVAPTFAAEATKLDDLELKLHRVFGYRFDFKAGWFHQVQVERIDKAIPTVTYPRLTKRSGKSPPQVCEKK